MSEVDGRRFFGTDQSASDGGAPDARGLHNPALRGDPGHPVCGGVLAGDGGADPGGGAGDPAVEAPRSRQAAAVPGDGGGVPQRLHQKQHGGPWTGFCPLPGDHLPVHPAVQHHRDLRAGPPHQGPERHGGTGHHERGADLWGTVSVPRAAGRAEKIYGAHAPAAAHQPDGGRDPAPGPVYAAVRQHPGGVHHHGADQDDGPGGGPRPVQHLLRPV